MDLSKASWRKASFSGDNGGNCVEVAELADRSVAVRDSKDPDGPKLLFTEAEWKAFVSGVKADEFDLG